ncbi:long-chain fatty acid--CoA ligase [Aquisalimonas sp.]|uniref:acyl-CoA synthetase n=1 Tax=Aquisalimonas sp. TaxID=1872621 RepID=UPI0025B8F2B9|nr:long-chain fatty acid--CoA ligase [Aquisalimonas sp.]
MPYAVDWLDRRARLSPEATALVDAASGKRISYAEWNAAANRTAHYLGNRLGVAKGDRVAVLAGNSVAYLDVWFACSKTGAILQNLNWRLAEAELAQLIQDAAPTVLFYGADFVDAVTRLRDTPGVESIRHWVALDGDKVTGDPCITKRDSEPADTPALPPLTHDDPWVICYTGGTTGLPKGAILTHGNIAWNAINTQASWGIGADDTAILNAPLFHTGALNVFTAPLVHAGGCSVVCSGFDANQVFDLIEGGDVSLFFGVPTMFSLLQEHPRWETADFSPLKLVISGGAPCPMPVFERFWDRGVDFKTGYGLTEAGPNTFWLPPEQVREKPGAVGYPLFHVEVKLQDSQTGATVTRPGVTGELLIRGPHRTPGYWNRPDATAEAIAPDGWLHTGDLARFDADGAYTIVGRLKDMFISGGENVYPAEIENVLHAHPEVADAAVFGVSDRTWGEVGCAVIVPVAGATLQARTLRPWLKERLARYKVPRRIEFVDALPTTGAGKIDKRTLQERFEDE